MNIFIDRAAQGNAPGYKLH